MTSFQKVIKYGAIAFAIYLCFIIISMIVFGITAIFGITVGLEMFENNGDNRNNTVMTQNFEHEYSNIKNIDIDLSVCKLNIKKGTTLKVEATQVYEQFECKVIGDKLKVKDKEFNNNIFDTRNFDKSEITIYIPENMDFEDITIETGVNESNIEFLKANRIKLVMGVGKYRINSIYAKYAKIEAGAGETIIDNGNIDELKLEGGIGKLAVTCKIANKANISSGVGRMELQFIGSLSDYKVEAENGLGNFVVNNQKITGTKTLGNGDAIIDIEAGMGETIVNFINS